MHRTGERQVAEGKGHTVAHLKVDRVAPWRTSAALATQSTIWPKFIDLLDQQRAYINEKLDRGESVKDPAGKKEIPDPNPEPEPVPQKRKADEALGRVTSEVDNKRFKMANGQKVEFGMNDNVVERAAPFTT